MTTHNMGCPVCGTPARLWQHDRKEVIDFGFGDREETIRHTYRMGCPNAHMATNLYANSEDAVVAWRSLVGKIEEDLPPLGK